MEFGTFVKLVDDYKCRKPVLFGLGHDRILSNDEIRKFECIYQIELSPKYKDFLLKYGGGYFGYANIYSLDKQSTFYILNHNKIPIDKYLRIADNGCGDYYLICVDDVSDTEQVFYYEHDTNTICKTEYADILEYLVKVGLKAKIIG